MDRALAEVDARQILGALADKATAEDWTDALDASVMPDQAGRWPNSAGWVPSCDPFWTAAQIADTLALRAMTVAQVTKWTSEGTSVETQAADLVTLAASLRARSSIPVESANLIALGVTQDAGVKYDPRSGSWPNTGDGAIVGNWS
jgi:hypothetical protein